MKNICYYLVTLLLFLFPLNSSPAELVLSKNGVTITLTDKPCGLPQVLDLLERIDHSKLKHGSVVFPTGSRQLCWMFDEDHIDIVDETMYNPGPLPLAAFNAKES